MSQSTTPPSSGLPGLYVEIRWGSELTEARTFGVELEEIFAGPSEQADLPLYGFTLPGERFLLARRTATGYRVFLPPEVRAERSVQGDAPVPLPREQLPNEGGQHYADLEASGTLLSFGEAQLKIVIRASEKVRRVRQLTSRDAMALSLLAVALLIAPLGFALMGNTNPADIAALNARALAAKRLETEARQQEIDRLYPSLPAGTVDAGSDTPRRNLPAAISVH